MSIVNETHINQFVEKTKETLMKPVKKIISLLVKEHYQPGDITEEEAIELYYVREMAEQAAKDAANGKTHGMKSFAEFAAEQRAVGGE